MKRIFIVLSVLLAAAFRGEALSLEDCYSLVRENYPLVKQYELTDVTYRKQN